METFSKDGDLNEGEDERWQHAASAPQGEGEDNFTVANTDVKTVRNWTSEDSRDSVKVFQASLLKSLERIYPASVSPTEKCDKEGRDDIDVQKGGNISRPNVLDIAHKFPGQVSDTINENLMVWRTAMLGLMAGGMLTAAWLGNSRLLRRWTRVEDIPSRYYATRRRVRVRVMGCQNGVILSEHIPPLLRIVPNVLRPAVATGSGRTLLPLRIPGVQIEERGEQWIRQNHGRVAQAELLFPERIDQHPHPSAMVFLMQRLGGWSLWRKVDVGEYLLHQGFASLDNEDYSTIDPYSHNLVKERALQSLSQV